MDGPPTKDGTQQLEQLIEAVEELRRRVAALERRGEPAPLNISPAVELSIPPTESSVTGGLSTGLLAGLGRLLLGMAGAYLLRAATEANIIPQLAGTLAGLLYACAWLLASLGIRTPNRWIAATHGLAASLIAGPLLWEATTRFHSLSPAAAAAAVALFVGVGQAVAWHRDQSLLAGITALAGSIIAVALIAATLDPVPFAIALAVAAAVVELGACRDRALALRWIVALAADFCAFLLAYLITRPQGLPEGYAPLPAFTVTAIPVALAAIYAASTATRTLIRRLPIAWFEIAQLAAIFTLAILSGLRVPGPAATGMASLAAGALCYLVAFTKVAGRSFHAYATLALGLVATGSLLLFSGLLPAALWSLAALAGIVLGERWNTNTLRLHGAVYLIAAASSSGLLAYPAGPVTAGAWLCAIATALAYGLTLGMRKAEVSPPAARIAPAILAALLCWSAVGLTAAAIAGAGFDASLLGTLRTALISLAAIALAWFGARWNLTELTWVLYPWMAFGAVKLLGEDFSQGRPATLFLSLLLYGGTLIALPRLLRRARMARPDLS